MPRPVKLRRIRFRPGVTSFRPAGVPLRTAGEVVLTNVELEAIRLADYEELSQGEAARKMNVSQPTFSRILESARKKIADALTNGKALKVEGGHYVIAGRRAMRRRYMGGRR